jgi:hypothetical protein
MRTALRHLAALVGRGSDDHILELVVVVVLIVTAAVLALVFLADPIADLISLIGGSADQAPSAP